MGHLRSMVPATNPLATVANFQQEEDRCNPPGMDQGIYRSLSTTQEDYYINTMVENRAEVGWTGLQTGIAVNAL